MNIVEWLRLWARSVSPKLDEAADEIERLRKENQTQALDFLASEGEWWELIGKKDKEIEQLQEAYRLVRDSYEDTANEVARLRKRDGFINKLDEQIVTKDAKIERLQEALNKISSEYREIANPYSFQKEIREVLQNPNVFTMIASIIHRYEKCVRIARTALKEGE
jgi:predicted RNase H-like nuclease (RuvC/YqgF family)